MKVLSVCTLPDVMRIMSCAGHVARMGEVIMRTVLVGYAQLEKPFGRET
jgi:hypothetical protein